MQLIPNRQCLAAPLLFLVLPMLGCGSDSPTRHVTGEVSFDGTPVPSGRITLTPGAGGHTVSGRIIDGGYNISEEKGPLPGNYSVSINSRQPTGRQIKHSESATGMLEEMKETIPARYNRRTELVITIADEGENKHDFSLTSDNR